MSNHGLIPWVATVCLLAACAPAGYDQTTVPSTRAQEPTVPPATATLPPVTSANVGPSPTTIVESQGAGWLVYLNISGGIAGLRRTAELSSSGKLVVTDQKLSKQVVAQVPENDLRNIASSVNNVSSLEPVGRLPTCPDCFSYDLNVRINGQSYSIRLNDMTLAKSGVESLIGALMDLQERALAGKLKP